MSWSCSPIARRCHRLATVTPPGKDYGVDIYARRGVLGLELPLIKAQVKSTERSIGAPAVAELLGRLATTGEAGLPVTLGYFSPDKRLGRERANLRLIDGAQFVDLLLSRTTNSMRGIRSDSRGDGCGHVIWRPKERRTSRTSS